MLQLAIAELQQDTRTIRVIETVTGKIQNENEELP